MELNYTLHRLAVASKMMERAKLLKPNEPEYAEDMFLLGFLHDIGHEYTTSGNYAHIGGRILKRQGFKYWKEVFWHGVIEPDCESNELHLLNYMDMTTTEDGSDITITERLKSVRDEYSNESSIYLDTVLLAGFVGNNLHKIEP